MALRRYVCDVADVVAGELRSFTVEGVTWPVLATVLDGTIVVSAGVCPHEDVSLAGGMLMGSTVICPGHGYRFDLRSGRCGHRKQLELRRYPVTIVDAQVWVDLL